jgi:hypothetical protein
MKRSLGMFLIVLVVSISLLSAISHEGSSYFSSPKKHSSFNRENFISRPTQPRWNEYFGRNGFSLIKRKRYNIQPKQPLYSPRSFIIKPNRNTQNKHFKFNLFPSVRKERYKIPKQFPSEISVATCGDEYYRYSWWAWDPEDGSGFNNNRKDESDSACCDDENDCVSNGVCYTKQTYHDFDSDSEIEYCYNGWADLDLDDGHRDWYCEHAGFAFTNAPCEGGIARCDDYDSEGWYCCGDDGESYKWRAQQWEPEDGSGFDNNRVDESDTACCDDEDDCVYNGVCTTKQTWTDYDSDGETEYCYQMWTDVDYDGTDGVGGSTDVYYCASQLGGIFTNVPCEGGIANCDDFDAEGWYCCGDDPGEYFITTQGRSACCDSPNDKVDENGNCVSKKFKVIYKALY